MITLRNIFVRLMIAAMLLTITLPLTGLSDPYQKRGRGYEKRAKRYISDRDDRPGYREQRNRWRKRNKKADKFINGRNARDGRWDGRGPRRSFRRLPPSRRWYR
jgi:hypothetical protein